MAKRPKPPVPVKLDRPIDGVMTAVGLLASLAPGIGGILSTVINNQITDAKFKRVEDALSVAYAEIRGMKATIPTTYVRAEEVADLVEKTLQQVYDEPIEQKRRMYGAFLAGVISSPGGDYNEKLKMLRVLEAVQPDHVRVLRAVAQVPPPAPDPMGASRSEVLYSRVKPMTRDLAGELFDDSADLRVTTMNGYQGMVTGKQARDLRTLLTPFGNRFVQYLRD